jgi:hypothetical protein
MGIRLIRPRYADHDRVRHGTMVREPTPTAGWAYGTGETVAERKSAQRRGTRWAAGKAAEARFWRAMEHGPRLNMAHLQDLRHARPCGSEPVHLPEMDEFWDRDRWTLAGPDRAAKRRRKKRGGKRY